jgi:hypothetical protein
VKQDRYDRPPPSGDKKKEGKLSLRERWFGSKKDREKERIEKEQKKLRREKREKRPCEIM